MVTLKYFAWCTSWRISLHRSYDLDNGDVPLHNTHDVALGWVKPHAPLGWSLRDNHTAWLVADIQL